jgi:hypothetical protein
MNEGGKEAFKTLLENGSSNFEAMLGGGAVL